MFSVNQGVFIGMPSDHAGAIREGCVKRLVSTANNRPFTRVSAHLDALETSLVAPRGFLYLPLRSLSGVYELPAGGVRRQLFVDDRKGTGRASGFRMGG
jgi:hypothetical protein